MKRNKYVLRTLLFAALTCLIIIPGRAKSNNIPYRVADHYFVSNTVKKLPTAKITTQKEFDELFGCAPVMGKNGEPTPIDFSKEYVIAVSKPETYHSETLTPISLTREKRNRIVFTYKVEIGSKQTYTIVPCLLIIVSKKENGIVKLRERIFKIRK